MSCIMNALFANRKVMKTNNFSFFSWMQENLIVFFFYNIKAASYLLTKPVMLIHHITITYAITRYNRKQEIVESGYSRFNSLFIYSLYLIIDRFWLCLAFAVYALHSLMEFQVNLINILVNVCWRHPKKQHQFSSFYIFKDRFKLKIELKWQSVENLC